MNLDETIPSDGMNKMLKDYANYKNICEEIKREREALQENYEPILPSFTLNRAKYSRRITKNSSYSSKLLDASSFRSEESTEVETWQGASEKDVISETEQEDDAEIARSQVGKKYEEKFKRRTAELQNEIDKLKSDREHDIDESVYKIDLLEKMLKQERKNNREKFHGLVSHYERIMQQTNTLKNKMLTDYDHIQARVVDLKDKIRSMQTQLQTDFANDFDNLLQGMHDPNDSFIPLLPAIKPSLIKVNEDVEDVSIKEKKKQNRPNSKGIHTKKQVKFPALKTRKVHCPRKEKEQIAKNI